MSKNRILEKYGYWTNEVNRLEKMDFLNKLYYFPFRTYLCLDHIESYIIIRKFQELKQISSSALFALSQGSHNKHTNIQSSDNNVTAIKWLRFEYLKNSMIWYNSCYDLLLLIVYVAFEFSYLGAKKTLLDVQTEKGFMDSLMKCKWKGSPFYKHFHTLSESNNEAKILFEKINGFYENNAVRNWCNILKHRGLIELSDGKKNCSFSVIENEKTIFCSDWLNCSLEMENVLKTLIETDKRVVEFTKYLFDYLGFNDVNEDVDQFTIRQPFSAKELLEK